MLGSCFQPRIMPLASRTGLVSGIRVLGRCYGMVSHSESHPMDIALVVPFAVFFYVDDAFFPSTGWILPDGHSLTQWMGDIFDEVVTTFGWELELAKSAVGSSVLLLGLQVTIKGSEIRWVLGEAKRTQWAHDLSFVLSEDELEAGHASKLAGRFAILNHWVFNRVGRALLRPIIWRQRQRIGFTALTKRLRFERIATKRHLPSCTFVCISSAFYGDSVF